MTEARGSDGFSGVWRDFGTRRRHGRIVAANVPDAMNAVPAVRHAVAGTDR
jgi:hypothetical protein